MRVRPRLPQRRATQRRPHVIARSGESLAPDAPDAMVAPPAPTPDVTAAAPPLDAERRYKASGAPHDQATYRCGCGFVFAAAVSTTVDCPHCGMGQAW